jgi:hypothetical protein
MEGELHSNREKNLAYGLHTFCLSLVVCLALEASLGASDSCSRPWRGGTEGDLHENGETKSSLWFTNTLSQYGGMFGIKLRPVLAQAVVVVNHSGTWLMETCTR